MTEPLTPEQAAWVERALPKVRQLAHRLARRMSAVTADDLESAGHEGLVRAALRYDPSTGVPFDAFAHYRVRGAMIDTARQASPGLRRHQRALKSLQTTQALLEEAEKRNPSAGAADRRSLRERVAAAAELVAHTTTAVVLGRVPPADPDTLETKEAGAEASLMQAELRATLVQILGECEPADRKLIDALYNRGLTMHEHAKAIGMSVSSVSRHHARLLGLLSQRIRERMAAA